MNETPDPRTEAQLRDALAERARTIEPSVDGLQRIEERVMEEETTESNAKKWWMGGGAVAAAALVGAIVFFAGDSDDDGSVVADEPTTTTTTEATTTTTTTEATTTTSTTTEPVFVPEVDPYGVAYPSPNTSQRFESPESAASSYATEVLGFTELVVGEYRQGDSRSGEVVITDRPGRLETVVLVRQMEDDTWFALGSQTPDIVVDRPAAGDVVSSPFDTTGSALAFEGTVTVVVRAQDDPALLGEGFVTGSGSPPAGPFSGTIDFRAPPADTPGIVVYRVHSAEDGHVTQATSFPIRLAAA